MSNLNFTAKIQPLTNSTGNLKAFATLIVNDVVAIANFRVMNGDNGLWVAPPSHKGTDAQGNDKWYNDVLFFEDTEDNRRGPVANAAFDAILAEYERGASRKTSTNPGKAQANRGNPTGGRPAAPGRRAAPAPADDDIPW